MLDMRDFLDYVMPIVFIILIFFLFITMFLEIKREYFSENTFKDNCIEIEEKYYCEIN